MNMLYKIKIYRSVMDNQSFFFRNMTLKSMPENLGSLYELKKEGYQLEFSKHERVSELEFAQQLAKVISYWTRKDIEKMKLKVIELIKRGGFSNFIKRLEKG